MKRLFASLAFVFTLMGCADTQQYLQSPNGKAVLATSETIAKVAVEAAATQTAGPLAAQLAGAGLDALASVLQGYIDKPVPAAIVKASPGIASVAKAVAPLIQSGQPITQVDVNTVYQAASIAVRK